MALNFTTTINGTDCIGDSRTTINNNFSALDVFITSLSPLTSLNTGLSTASLSARFINLVHSPFNGGVNPNFFIGEAGDGTVGSITDSLTGFNITYDEINNTLNTSTQQGSATNNIVVSYGLNGNVGIGTTLPNQLLTVNGNISATGLASVSALTVYGNISATGLALTVNGNISSTGFASVSALQLNNTTTQTTLLSTLTTVSKFPIYDANGTLLGFIPICNF
jgi:hypothetical protein